MSDTSGARRMKIVHVSNFTTKWNGDNYFTIPYKLNNGLTRLGHNVFSVCDRDIADSLLFGIRAAGRAYANRKLRAICEHVRPDFLLLGHCTLIAPQTIESIRRLIPGLHIAHWNCDPLFFADNMARLKALAPLADATFVTTAGPLMQSIAEGGRRVAFMPNPVDTSIDTLRAFEMDALPFDLVFMGSPVAERAALCDSIRERLPELKFETRGFGGAPPVSGARLFDFLAQSRMGLSLSRRDDVPLYASDRMSIMMGNGLLTFVDRRTGFESLFSPDELVLFEGVDELVDRLRALKADDAARKRIAFNGWRKIHEIFSETRVAQWIVDVTLGRTSSPAPLWGSIVNG